MNSWGGSTGLSDVESGSGFDVGAASLALWGKSKQGGAPNRLLQHLYDTAAVGEVMWDRYLPHGVRQRIDAITGERGRQFFALLCGLHDVGKATPNFQSQDERLAARVRAAGLEWRSSRVGPTTSIWHHTVAGAHIVKLSVTSARWPGEQVKWVWPLILGHHGRIGHLGEIKKLRDDHGQSPPWSQSQGWLVAQVARAIGYSDLGVAAPMGVPSRGDQLALLGFLIMADWVASNDVLRGVDDPSQVSIELARDRAPAAWTALDLRGGWAAGDLPEGDPIHARFGQAARGIQAAVARAALAMPTSGLLIVEAPMGEGKTKAALVAAEILAHRFGARGIFVGMPTQATSDPMFDQIHSWSRQVAPDLPIVLLHGKRMFNKNWKALQAAAAVSGVDEFGCEDDPYGQVPETAPTVVVDWFLGSKRGLLTPLVVGTIDQLLYAGTRTKHVMLRHAGLAGKVVILDEVHAASVYMAQFLQESLRWLASARTPVVLLTATLPPDMRRRLVAAYLEGAAWTGDVDLSGLPEDLDYPGLLAVCPGVDGATYLTDRGDPWRASANVAIEVLDGGDDKQGVAIAALLAEELGQGGLALVIRNTVSSAQETYRTLKAQFGGEVSLLHSRLTASDRAARTEKELLVFGPRRPGDSARTGRHILVATQVAEQSFDVDADLLVTDLAPIDLLLQRIGRLHRHERDARPARLKAPRVVVSGFRRHADGPPELAPGSVAVYRAHRLLRAAALVEQAVHDRGWSVPADVPSLVAKGYGNECYLPESWASAAESARLREDQWEQEMRAAARQYVLTARGDLGPAKRDLVDLHRGSADAQDDEAMRAVVREGQQSAEVVLVRRSGDGDFLTLSGRRLTNGGAWVDDADALEEAAGSMARLPGGDAVAAAVAGEPVPANWQHLPQVGSFHPLVLTDELRAERYGLRYDAELGIVDEGRASR